MARNKSAKGLFLLLRYIFISGFMIMFSISGYAQTKIRVAVAASLMLPLEEVKKEYEKENPGIHIELIGGSSGNLTTQIKNGAPFHIFLSANWAYPQELFNQGFSTQNPQVITNGKMAIWTKSEITLIELSDFLLNGKAKAITIANPQLAPYGWTAKKWLEQNGIWEKVKGQIIYGQSISQVNQYIYSGNVEIAFTAVSAANAEKLKGIGNWLIIEDENFLVPNGGIILKSDGRNNSKTTASFFNFLLENTAVNIFQQYGYTHNGEPK
ncbi:molybdate ABC transporter substrate-binding protein [Flexithrix dorotheae]|uniref:molybdate ABC transporter substrate-binding protein n=1 Tax=Flexithrix dorotheae TaxID=70993 RepID=UPI000A07471A|nr:molybdate ABC transporter substrate-binding protein [Flexithrix dorotheae]